MGSWGRAAQMDLGFVIFSAFVTAHLKSQGPEAQDRWNLLKKESVSNLTEILPNVQVTLHLCENTFGALMKVS